MAVTDPPRVYLHDGAGVRKAEITTALNIERGYEIMSPATARFTVSTDEPELANLNLDPRSGRIVVIESTLYPYPWLGKLTVPRGQRGSETVQVSARAYDAVLSQRFVAGTFAGSAGSVFTQLIEAANQQNHTGIVVASGVSPGPAYSAIINIQSVYQALNTLARATGHEWWLDCTADAAGIVVTAHFAPSRGFDRCGVAFINDGGNGQWDDWKINGEATAFAMTVYGGAEFATQAWSERPRSRRQSSTALGAGSKAAQGTYHGHAVQRTDPGGSPMTRVERLQVAESIKAEGLLQAAADTQLGRPYEPERALTARVWAVDHAGNAVDWSPFDLGSVISLRMPGAFVTGYEGSARVTGVQPNEEAGELDLVLELLGSGDHA